MRDGRKSLDPLVRVVVLVHTVELPIGSERRWSQIISRTLGGRSRRGERVLRGIFLEGLETSNISDPSQCTAD